MKKTLLWSLFVLVGTALSAAPQEKVWDYSKELPMNNAALQMRYLPDVKTPDGSSVIEVIQPVPMEKILYYSHIQFPLKTAFLKNGDTVEVSFYVKGEPGTAIEMRCTEVLPYSGHFSETKAFGLKGEWQKITATFTIRNLYGEAYSCVPRMLFPKHEAGKPFYFGPLTIKNLGVQK